MKHGTRDLSEDSMITIDMVVGDLHPYSNKIECMYISIYVQ
jgi:hypothetical protein